MDSSVGQALHGQVGQSEKTIAHVDGLGRPPGFPDGGAAVAQRALILDVVMDKGEVVYQLDGRGNW
jgi:hypothetical protein